VRSLSIVIPAYNEEVTIADIIQRSLHAAQAWTNDFEVLVLDDKSKDRTVEIIQSICAQNPRVTLIRHEVNQGIAVTFEELYRLASKEYVFLVSGDGQFPPELLHSCIPLLENADIIICQRTYKPYNIYRHIVSWSFRWIPYFLFGVDLYDAGSVKLMPKRYLVEIPVTSHTVFVEAERLLKAKKLGARIAAVKFSTIELSIFHL
jgi:glycosyltransferase involved in cell wall biosynthesis